MKIKKIRVENFIGISEFSFDAGNINVIEGPTGAGKSSVIEAIEMGLAKTADVQKSFVTARKKLQST